MPEILFSKKEISNSKNEILNNLYFCSKFVFLGSTLYNSTELSVDWTSREFQNQTTLF